MAYLKQLNIKNRFFILIGIYAILFILWLLFFQLPLLMQMKQLNKSSDELKQLLNTATQMANDKAGIISAVDSLNNQIEWLKAKTVSINELGPLKDDYIYLCHRFNIKCDEFKPLIEIYYQRLEQNPGRDYHILPVMITLTSNFENYIRFVESYPEFKYFITPGFIEISPDDKTENIIHIRMISRIVIKNRDKI